MFFGDNFDQKLDLTHISDAAKFIANVVSDPDRVGEFRFAAEQLTPREIADLVKKYYENIEIKKFGSLDDLIEKTMEFKKQGKFVEATYYMYAMHALDGSGKFDSIDNSKFQNIKPLGLEDYIRDGGKKWFIV